MDCLQDNTINNFTLQDYLKGKVADFTISDNVIVSVCADRGVNIADNVSEIDNRIKMLCYADLLRYIYLQPSLTKSYSQTNGVWSQKEGSTQFTTQDKDRIFEEMKRIYAKYGEGTNIPPRQSQCKIRTSSKGIKVWR